MSGTTMSVRAPRCLGRGALLAVVVGLALGGCGDDAPSPTSVTSPDAGLANPASVYCVEQGGSVEIVDEEDGQVGYCNLPDGRRVDEWEFFRSETGATGP